MRPVEAAPAAPDWRTLEDAAALAWLQDASLTELEDAIKVRTRVLVGTRRRHGEARALAWVETVRAALDELERRLSR